MIARLLYYMILWSSADITQAEFIDHILAEFPSVRIAQKDVLIANAKNKTAEGAFDTVLQTTMTQSQGNYEYKYLQSRIVKPTSLFGLNLYGGFRKSSGSPPIYDGQLETLSEGEWSVGAKLPLLRGFWIDARRTELLKSQLQVKRQNYQLRTTELSQIKKALTTYWDWKLARERLRIQNELLSVATLRDQWLEKRARAGDVAHFERNDNLRNILQRKSYVLQNQQKLKSAQADLLMYLSDPTLSSRVSSSATEFKERSLDWVLPTSLDSLFESPEALLSKALAQRPELQALVIQKEQLQADKDLARNEFLPRLDLEAQYSKDSGSGSSKLGDDNLKLSLNLEVPLQYRRIRGNSKQANLAMERIDYEKQLLERQWRAEIISLQNNLQVSLERRALAHQELTLAKQLNVGELSRFRHGGSSILTVNLREQAAAEAELRLADMTADLMKNHVSLVLALGEIPKY
jgi:outer membrane protein, heavy metal efflux system